MVWVIVDYRITGNWRAGLSVKNYDVADADPQPTVCRLVESTALESILATYMIIL
jgi:hypothetical protein